MGRALRWNPAGKDKATGGWAQEASAFVRACGVGRFSQGFAEPISVTTIEFWDSEKIAANAANHSHFRVV
jgi:hypothetical protein